MASLSVIVAILGNIISILAFLSPVGTFQRIVKKKSTEEFTGYTYVCTLLCTSLWTFYGILKPGGFLIATVNGAGAFLQAVYLTLYIIYALKDTKALYLRLAGFLNIGCLGLVLVMVFVVFHGRIRLTILGILCAGLTLGMYGAPLSAMGTVIKTKSVEYMPFLLSFFLFLNAGVWSFYAVLVRDYYIGVPNAVGLVFGSAQLVLWGTYHRKSGSKKSVEKVAEEGSSDFVKKDLEMGEYDEKQKKEQNPSKGASLPKTPVLLKQSLQKIGKARSATPSQLKSMWSLEGDFENVDLKANHR